MKNLFISLVSFSVFFASCSNPEPAKEVSATDTIAAPEWKVGVQLWAMGRCGQTFHMEPEFRKSVVLVADRNRSGVASSHRLRALDRPGGERLNGGAQPKL